MVVVAVAVVATAAAAAIAATERPSSIDIAPGCARAWSDFSVSRHARGEDNHGLA